MIEVHMHKLLRALNTPLQKGETYMERLNNVHTLWVRNREALEKGLNFRNMLLFKAETVRNSCLKHGNQDGLEFTESIREAIHSIARELLSTQAWKAAEKEFKELEELLNQVLEPKNGSAFFSPGSPDAWTILGCPAGSDKKTIKSQYRKRAQECHPDRGGSDAEMAALNSAYQKLMSQAG